VDDLTPALSHPALDADGVADFVTEQILLAADQARAHDRPHPELRRSWAWLELSGLTLLAAGVVATLLF
jgi:hypothetical protein